MPPSATWQELGLVPLVGGGGGESPGVASLGLVPTPLSVGGAPARRIRRVVARRPAVRASVRASTIISPSGITRAPFVPANNLPVNAGYYRFEDARARTHCWRLGRETAAEFAARSGAIGMGDKLFNTSRIKIFFPVRDEYFAVRTVTINGAATAERVLRAIENTATLATAFHLKQDRGVEHPTEGDVRRVLADAVVCHLMCRRVGGGNHVYVRLTSSS